MMQAVHCYLSICDLKSGFQMLWTDEIAKFFITHFLTFQVQKFEASFISTYSFFQLTFSSLPLAWLLAHSLFLSHVMPSRSSTSIVPWANSFWEWRIVCWELNLLLYYTDIMPQNRVYYYFLHGICYGIQVIGFLCIQTLTLVLLRVFPKHIFLRGGCCNPPLDYQYWRSYNPKFTTSV